MELLQNVQISAIFLLQKFRIHAVPLLVRVFLWFQCAGKAESLNFRFRSVRLFIPNFQTVFDPMYISVYNLFYTALPVLALGIFESDVSDKLSIEYPKLYAPGLTNALFNTTEFIRSVLHGVFSALVLFLIPYGKFLTFG